MAPIAVSIESGTDQVINGTLKDKEIQKRIPAKLTKEQDHVLKTFRLLITDLCQQFNGGHPGYAYHRHVRDPLLTRRAEAPWVWRQLELLYGNMSCGTRLTLQTSSIATDLCCQMGILVFFNILFYTLLDTKR